MPRFPLLPALPLLAACAMSAGGPGAGVTLSAAGEPVPLFSLADIAAAGGEVFAQQAANEGPSLFTAGGGTTLYIPASADRLAWDYALALSVAWDVELPAGGDPGPALLAAPFLATIEVRPPSGEGAAYRAGAGQVDVDFESLAATPDGIAAKGTFSATACDPQAPQNCIPVTGGFGLVVPDRRREPGAPDPDPILL